MLGAPTGSGAHCLSESMTDFQKTIDAFVDAFNRNDLDAVMTFFAEDAVYLPGDGREHRGVTAIRAAFRPQFEGLFGRMRFDEHDRLVDVDARKMAIRWTCRHELGAPEGVPRLKGAFRLAQAALHTAIGKRFGWEGLDVFHFDAQGRISGKFSYANYPLPLLRRSLGRPLT
jgi:uncharacterized protein (TIGR02246 family)